MICRLFDLMDSMTFLQQIWFIIVLLILFIVPGWLILRSVFPYSKFTVFEWVVIAITLSLASLNFLMLSLDRAGILLTAPSITIALIVECGLFWWLATRRASDVHPLLSSRLNHAGRWAVLTLFIKGVFLFGNVTPSATDLGHHMYWSKQIAETGHAPVYTKRDIINTNGAYSISAPTPIADFIVGEHLPFAALALLSGASFFSAFPVTFLLFVNLVSVLALFALAWRLFYRPRTGQGYARIALLTLLLVGPIYALSSPQAKFVSGGVVGNTLGNLFIPVLFLVYYRAFKEKSAGFLTLGFFLTFGLAYIHHLSTLMFLAGAFFALVIFGLLHIRTLPSHIRDWWRLVSRPAPIIFIAVAIVFFFFVYLPSYADPHAIGTAVGAPSKTTRAGMSLLDFSNGTIGIVRMGLGLAGLLLLFLSRDRIRYASAFLLGWAGSLLVMSLRPQLVFINIPSTRVSSYAIFPLALLAAWLVVRIAEYLRPSEQSSLKKPRRAVWLVPSWLVAGAATVWIGSLLATGYTDNAQELGTKEKNQGVLETFAVSRYVAAHVSSADVVLKDHNYLLADSWMKSFFMRDYTYPLSRGYFKRYSDDTKTREQCTLWMISIPNTQKGQQCYDQTGTDYVIVNPRYDKKQFEQSTEFSLVYASNGAAVYQRQSQGRKE